jgi:hypothetical protein
MQQIEHDLMMVGIKHRLLALAGELQKIVNLAPDEVRPLANQAIRPILHPAHGGARTKGADKTKVKLAADLAASRATRESKPATDAKAEKRAARAKRTRKSWTPAMRQAAAERMKSFWKAAKKQGTSLNKGFKPSTQPGYTPKGIKADRVVKTVNGNRLVRKPPVRIPALGEPIHSEPSATV